MLGGLSLTVRETRQPVSRNARRVRGVSGREFGPGEVTSKKKGRISLARSCVSHSFCFLCELLSLELSVKECVRWCPRGVVCCVVCVAWWSRVQRRLHERACDRVCVPPQMSPWSAMH